MLLGFPAHPRPADGRRTLCGGGQEQSHARGLIQYGEALENGRPSLGDDMEMRSFTDVPMAAMWTYNLKAPLPS